MLESSGLGGGRSTLMEKAVRNRAGGGEGIQAWPFRCPWSPAGWCWEMHSAPRRLLAWQEGPPSQTPNVSANGVIVLHPQSFSGEGQGFLRNK